MYDTSLFDGHFVLRSLVAEIIVSQLALTATITAVTAELGAGEGSFKNYCFYMRRNYSYLLATTKPINNNRTLTNNVFC